MLFLLSISVIVVSLLVGAVAGAKRAHERREWQVRERERMRAEWVLTEVRRRQRSHDFLIDEALLTESLRKETK